MKLTNDQYEQLLKPLNASRVQQRNQAGNSLSYLEAWDVKAHLIRIFGFGGWSADVLSADLAFEDSEVKDGKTRWSVGYKVIMRLRIHADNDFLGDTTYTEAAVGFSTQPQRGEAHDMAIKTAESDALKRAAINLGTQFGLSLYDNGNRNDVVKGTLVPPIDYATAAPTVTLDSVSDTDAGANDLVAEAEVCDTKEGLKEIWDMAVEANWLDTPITSSGAASTLRQVIIDRLAEIDQQ